MLLQSLKVALELLQMVTHDPCVITVVDHVDVTEVLSWFHLMLTTHLNRLIDTITSTIESSALRGVLYPEVLLVLATIHLD